jgi:hypothetical protein
MSPNPRFDGCWRLMPCASQRLIDGQRNDLFLPLVLEGQNSCLQAWRAAGHGRVNCP